MDSLAAWLGFNSQRTLVQLNDFVMVRRCGLIAKRGDRFRRVHPPTVYTYQPYSPIGQMPRGTSRPLKPVPVETRSGVMKAPGTDSIV